MSFPEPILVATGVEFHVMGMAERHGVLVTRSQLPSPPTDYHQMMSFGGVSANQTRQGADVVEIC